MYFFVLLYLAQTYILLYLAQTYTREKLVKIEKWYFCMMYPVSSKLLLQRTVPWVVNEIGWQSVFFTHKAAGRLCEVPVQAIWATVKSLSKYRR